MTAATKPHRQPYEPGKRDEWRTPRTFVAGIERRWQLILDAAACAESTVAPRYIDHELDALRCDWQAPKIAPGYLEAAAEHGGGVRVGGPAAVWCNPPFSQALAFVTACRQWSSRLQRPVLMLGPASVGTFWWADAFILAAEVWFVDLRLQFEPPPGISKSSNTAGSTLFVFMPTGSPIVGHRLCGMLGRDGMPVDPSLRHKWIGGE